VASSITNITTRTTATLPVKRSKKRSGEGIKVEKDEFIIDGGKSAMMTMRRRPMTDRSRLELRQSHFTETESEFDHVIITIAQT